MKTKKKETYSCCKNLIRPNSGARNPLKEYPVMFLQNQNSNRKMVKLHSTIKGTYTYTTHQDLTSEETITHLTLNQKNKNWWIISYIFTTWSRAEEQEMPDQPQGSASKAFQLDKTICGSSYIASLNVVSAQTAQKSINSI
jgi:hypothetical protein